MLNPVGYTGDEVAVPQGWVRREGCTPGKEDAGLQPVADHWTKEPGV